MDVVIIGSGTVALRPDRICAGYYVETGPHRILLDCGPGTPHQLARFGLAWERLTHVALSHFHTDHVAGLPLLLFAMKHGLEQPRSERMGLVGPEGMTTLLEKLADAFGDYMRDPGFPLDLREMRDDGAWLLDDRTLLRAHRTPHTEASVAYRLEADEGVLGYTGDTGMSEELGDFFSGVDLLIAECSLPDELAMESHLTPSKVAALARRARPRRLLVTHIYPQLDALDVVGLIRAAGWDGELTLASDGLRLSVGARH